MPTLSPFAPVIAALEELAHDHPEAAGPLAVELSAWLDAEAADATDYAERIHDEP